VNVGDWERHVGVSQGIKDLRKQNTFFVTLLTYVASIPCFTGEAIIDRISLGCSLFATEAQSTMMEDNKNDSEELH
jgi:hypothetical protein